MNTNKAKVKLVVSSAHRRAAETFLDAVEGPFRRAGLSKALYGLTAPRSGTTADRIADALMRELAKAGRIQRHGHLHWVKVSKERKLRSGRVVPERNNVAELRLTTRCPDKWLAVDLENGTVFAGGNGRWRKATPVERKEAMACIKEGAA